MSCWDGLFSLANAFTYCALFIDKESFTGEEGCQGKNPREKDNPAVEK